jgi:hypothetical protein
MSLIDQVVDVLERTTSVDSLRERLIGWGWVSPSGDSLTWEHWCGGSVYRRLRTGNTAPSWGKRR